MAKIITRLNLLIKHHCTCMHPRVWNGFRVFELSSKCKNFILLSVSRTCFRRKEFIRFTHKIFPLAKPDGFTCIRLVERTGLCSGERFCVWSRFRTKPILYGVGKNQCWLGETHEVRRILRIYTPPTHTHTHRQTETQTQTQTDRQTDRQRLAFFTHSFVGYTGGLAINYDFPQSGCSQVSASISEIDMTHNNWNTWWRG